MPLQLTRHPEPILERDTSHSWEAGSVLNPSVLYLGGRYHMFYRATNGSDRDSAGQYMSSIGYATSSDGIYFSRNDQPLLAADQLYENGRGCEDPRVTYIDGTYYMYYTAVAAGEHGGIDVRLALATSRDLQTFTKHGIVGPRGTRSKAGCLLPEKVDGQYIMYFTDMSDSPSSTILAVPLANEQEIVQPHDKILAALENYDDSAVIRPEPFQSVFRGPELGAVPVKTDAGWLMVYCGANHRNHREWMINAALLDANNPTKVIASLPDPILSPKLADEQKGIANNAVFPSGTVIVGDELYVYYGSGDQDIRLATCKLRDLLDELSRYPTPTTSND